MRIPHSRVALDISEWSDYLGVVMAEEDVMLDRVVVQLGERLRDGVNGIW